MKKSQPNYKKIYRDIILKKYPEKMNICKLILEKTNFSMLDVININNMIFGTNNKDILINNQKFKSYDESTVLYILDYQRKNRLNNSQVANHFKLSRNSIAKWKKIFSA
ncbi:helix-turn-helix domain-containing protein [Chryseobacterium sediminis]|uniref:Helix-turn-helix domain-containing protein n=1 Tax=Chryseobacterium sediminis TaxID=1679494 RepID=A0A5B2TPE3_9FLAO|nr:helix-turn-helix domain-containing protein [Chryseobacterium sediminis]KAA2215698.1 helix-turn-helix domain-containing protein [Chryseobacterium sediminis]